MYHKIYFTADKIAKRLALIEPLVYRQRFALPPFWYLPLPSPAAAPPLGLEIDRSTWQEIRAGDRWGRRSQDFILSTTFTVPADWSADDPIALYLPLGEAGAFSHPEALAYIDGEAYAACDRHHQEILLPKKWHTGQHILDLHGWIGMIADRDGDPNPTLCLSECQIVVVDALTRQLTVLARTALETAQFLPESDPARARLLNALDAAFKLLDLHEPVAAGFYASIPDALARLQAGIDQAGPALDVTVTATGHAHIDVAWLWTLGQTRRKAGRTFHTVLRLMEQFPEYHFTQSQPQLYDYVAQDYPALFEAIKARVAEGRWEIIGGMWVEADCNISGSEALARQFLLGRSYFRRHFGAETESPVLWLPDVFGYAWNLPQLIKEAGLEYFYTIKIGWSQYNHMPVDSFWWQGLDGTKVLTHFSTSPDLGGRFPSSYNALASPGVSLGTWTNFRQKEAQSDLLMSFGYGDGGGGPTRQMLENIQAIANFPGLPQTHNGSAGDFFRNMEREAGARLPTWNGELYLELHRGTYTSQSRNKRANRKSEFGLHDVEFLAALATHANPAYVYPKALLARAWELLCLNQFHDIIPGSSIGPVYVESQEQYREIAGIVEQVGQTAADALGSGLLVVNPTSFSRQDPAFYPGQLSGAGYLLDGVPVVTQPVTGGTLLTAGPLAPYSVQTLVQTDTPTPSLATGPLTVSPTLIENSFLRVELNAAGDIVRILDKANGREVLPAGAIAGQWQALEDRPLDWDAWDVDIFYNDKCDLAEPASAVVVAEHGPLRATIEIHRRILRSKYVLRIALTHNSPRLDFDVEIDWRERHTLLKVAFPVEVFSPVATYEIQWGNTERPTHHNTSWDWARFESCAQKWVDLSEGDYGVSLLNDCKHGHDIRDNVMRISLLRAPTNPDPEADQGHHRFAYSLLPHAGRWDERTVAAAYTLNDPLLVLNAGGGTPAALTGKSLFQIDSPHVAIETIKQAEDGNGFIVRLFEYRRTRSTVHVLCGFDVAQAWRVNLLEEEARPLPFLANRVEYAIRPYEIVTLRIVPI